MTVVILVLCTCYLLGPNDDIIVQPIRHVRTVEDNIPPLSDGPLLDTLFLQ